MPQNPSIGDRLLFHKRLAKSSIVRRLLFIGLVFWVPVIVAISLAEEVIEKEPIAGDTAFLLWLNQFRSPGLDSFAVALTNTAGALQMVLVSAVLITLLYLLKKWRAATYLLFSWGGASVINFILKLVFARDRPDLWATVVTEASYSFPSGHAMGSSAFAFSIIILLWNTRWRIPALIIGLLYTVAIGLTRTYLGVHYPSDVIAGWCISLIWALLVKAALDRSGSTYKLLRDYVLQHKK